MAVTLTIPITHRHHCRGLKEISLDATTLGTAVQALCQACPDMAPHLLDAHGRLRWDIEVRINARLLTKDETAEGLSLALSQGDHILLSSIIAGG